MTEQQSSLRPVFSTCPTGYFNPCLEACHRDPTTCCYYQGPAATAPKKIVIPAKYLPFEPIARKERPHHCNSCGCEEPSKFYPGNKSTCSRCQNVARSVRYAKAKRNGAPILAEVTRICAECGAEYVKLKIQTRRSKCARCRGVEGME